MSERIPIIMFGMARYGDWLAGVSNRQLEILEQLRRREDIGPILHIDMAPWRWRDIIRDGWRMYRTKLPVLPRYSRPWRRCFKVNGSCYVLSSLSRVGTGSWRLLYADIIAAMRAIGIERPVVWSYVPSAATLVSALPHRLRVFDAVDNWLQHPSYAVRYEQLEVSYHLIAESTDVIFTVNPANQILFPKRSDVMHVPNGVAIERYAESHEVPPELRQLPRPILGYIGTIQDRLDTEIIRRLSKDYPQASIVLVGRIWYRRLRRQLRALPNVHLVGFKARAEAPAYIQAFDVALIPYRRDAFLASTEVMKIYEYLAAGKPVVTTTENEFAFSGLLYSAGNPAAFSVSIGTALAEDSPELKTQRQLAAANADWGARAAQMVNIINKRLESV